MAGRDLVSGPSERGLVSALVEHESRNASCIGTGAFFCPVHADGDVPNLSVRYDPAGERVLAHCFSCAANGAQVANALGLPTRALFDRFWPDNVPMPDRVGTPPARAGGGRSAIGESLRLDVLALAWKLPEDALGRLVYERERNGQPFIAFPHLDPARGVLVGRERHGLYAPVLNPAGERGGIFNPLALQDARESERLGVVESEHDAIVLTLAGFPAVATAGANGWRPDVADYIAAQLPDGAALYVFPHRDAAGERFARDVAERFPETRFVRLPEDVGEHGDISDVYVRDPEGFPEWLGRAMRYARKLRGEPHGRSGYDEGCRCQTCTEAATGRVREQRAAGRAASISESGATLIERARGGPETEKNAPEMILSGTLEDVLRLVPEEQWCIFKRRVGLYAKDGSEARLSVFRCLSGRCPHCVGAYIERALLACQKAWADERYIYRSHFTAEEWKRRGGRAARVKAAKPYLRVLIVGGSFEVFGPEGDELLTEPGDAIARALLRSPASPNGAYRTTARVGRSRDASCTCPSDYWPCKHVRALRCAQRGMRNRTASSTLRSI